MYSVRLLIVFIPFCDYLDARPSRGVFHLATEFKMIIFLLLPARIVRLPVLLHKRRKTQFVQTYPV